MLRCRDVWGAGGGSSVTKHLSQVLAGENSRLATERGGRHSHNCNHFALSGEPRYGLDRRRARVSLQLADPLNAVRFSAYLLLNISIEQLGIGFALMIGLAFSPAFTSPGLHGCMLVALEAPAMLEELKASR